MLRTSAFLSSVNTTLTGRDVSATQTVQSCWCKGIFLAGENKFDLTVGVSRVYVVHVRTGRKKASVVVRRGFFHPVIFGYIYYLLHRKSIQRDVDEFGNETRKYISTVDRRELKFRFTAGARCTLKQTSPAR